MINLLRLPTKYAEENKFQTKFTADQLFLCYYIYLHLIPKSNMRNKSEDLYGYSEKLCIFTGVVHISENKQRNALVPLLVQLAL